MIIADRPYPLKIRADEEEIVRKAAKQINLKIKEFQNQYAAKDKQDYLAMCILMYAVQILKNEDKIVIRENDFTDRLKDLDNIITEFLNENV